MGGMISLAMIVHDPQLGTGRRATLSISHGLTYIVVKAENRCAGGTVCHLEDGPLEGRLPRQQGTALEAAQCATKRTVY